MKTYHHLSDSKRANIALLLNSGESIGQIATKLGLTRSTVQREIIRNRRKIEDMKHFGKCPLLRHRCSVCNACKLRHKCMLIQYIYHDDIASRSASIRKHTANSGPRIPLADFLRIDDELYDLVAEKGHSVEAAWHCSEVLRKRQLGVCGPRFLLVSSLCKEDEKDDISAHGEAEGDSRLLGRARA